MAILWFGKETKLRDLKRRDLEQERLVQQVSYDQLLARQRRASQEHDNILAAARAPGVSDAEIELAAYKMDRSTKRRTAAEAEMQGIISKLEMLDSTLELINRQKELESSGIWAKINQMDPDKLAQQLKDFAVERKKGEMNMDRIAEILSVDEIDVKAKRSAGFRREMDLIKNPSTNY